MHENDPAPGAMKLEQLQAMALRVSAEMTAAAGSSNQTLTASGGGSRHRGLPESLRAQFIEVRAALFQRGLYDPVLVRFDTATVAQASSAAVATRLAQVAEALGSVTTVTDSSP